MAEKTGITWTDHTFNPWWGCVKVSPGCDHCYAEADAHRYGHDVWGKNAERRFFGEKHWNEPRKWNQKAAQEQRRHKVFCASMADIFEDHYSEVASERVRLFQLINQTSNLDWLLLTKRPGNIISHIRKAAQSLEDTSRSQCEELIAWTFGGWIPPNVWLGTTVENNDYRWRIDEILKMPARIHFLSVEPQIGPVDLEGYLTKERSLQRVDWVIIGGESGHGARPFRLEWASDIIALCKQYDVAVFNKQLGSKAMFGGQFLEESRFVTLHRKGADPNEWPEDLRVQEFPVVA